MHQPDDRPDDQPPTRADDRPDDQAADARWMTFAELAASRGISKESAIALVRRKRWRRQQDNKGRVIALVPNDGPELRRAVPGAADNPPDDRPDYLAHTAAFETALAAIESAHASDVAALRAQADAAEQARQGAQALADMALDRLAAAEARSERAEQASREQMRALQANLDIARQQAQEAVRSADQGRVDAEAERMMRARADALVANLEVDLRAAQSGLAEQRIAAEQAQAAAEALRQSDAARKARGRWARLRAAWRGE